MGCLMMIIWMIAIYLLLAFVWYCIHPVACVAMIIFLIFAIFLDNNTEHDSNPRAYKTSWFQKHWNGRR